MPGLTRNEHPPDADFARQSAACSGPAPPKAIMVKSRGSKPRSIVTLRTAMAMVSVEMRRIPEASASIG